MIIFAYGTLRPGGSRHDSIASHLIDTSEGTFEGRLFVMPDGSPIATVGESA